MRRRHAIPALIAGIVVPTCTVLGNLPVDTSYTPKPNRFAPRTAQPAIQPTPTLTAQEQVNQAIALQEAQARNIQNEFIQHATLLYKISRDIDTHHDVLHKLLDELETPNKPARTEALVRIKAQALDTHRVTREIGPILANMQRETRTNTAAESIRIAVFQYADTTRAWTLLLSNFVDTGNVSALITQMWDTRKIRLGIYQPMSGVPDTIRRACELSGVDPALILS